MITTFKMLGKKITKIISYLFSISSFTPASKRDEKAKIIESLWNMCTNLSIYTYNTVKAHLDNDKFVIYMRTSRFGIYDKKYDDAVTNSYIIPKYIASNEAHRTLKKLNVKAKSKCLLNYI